MIHSFRLEIAIAAPSFSSLYSEGSPYNHISFDEQVAFTLLSQAGISKAVSSKFALVAPPRYTLTVSNTLS